MILNRQREIRVSLAELERFAARASDMLGISADALAICLVDLTQMARWNRAYRGKNGPTDVLSFPTTVRDPKSTPQSMRRLPRRSQLSPTSTKAFTTAGFAKSYLGDIAIAPAVARANARRFGRTLDEEMRILILHGMLHLMGYDHETDSGQMDRREQQLRVKLGLK
jgi:probable rRNA maturation factor